MEIQLTEDELQEIERFAGLFFSPKRVAILFSDKHSSISLEAEINEEGSAAHGAYYRGLYKAEAEVRQKVIELAKAGSSPAQSLAVKFMEEVRLEMV